MCACVRLRVLAACTHFAYFCVNNLHPIHMRHDLLAFFSLRLFASAAAVPFCGATLASLGRYNVVRLFIAIVIADHRKQVAQKCLSFQPLLSL